jgi:hypothetical protein
VDELRLHGEACMSLQEDSHLSADDCQDLCAKTLNWFCRMTNVHETVCVHNEFGIEWFIEFEMHFRLGIELNSCDRYSLASVLGLN